MCCASTTGLRDDGRDANRSDIDQRFGRTMSTVRPCGDGDGIFDIRANRVSPCSWRKTIRASLSKKRGCTLIVMESTEPLASHRCVTSKGANTCTLWSSSETSRCRLLSDATSPERGEPGLCVSGGCEGCCFCVLLCERSTSIEWSAPSWLHA